MANSSWSDGLLTISGDEGRVSTPTGGLWRCVFPAQSDCSEVIRGGMGTLQAEKLGPLRVRGFSRHDDGSGGAGQGHGGHAAGLAGDPRPEVLAARFSSTVMAALPVTSRPVEVWRSHRLDSTWSRRAH